ncbi:Neurotrypsin [Aphelenchoides besseyi]|nr:Neurotrypsin [Aphelenchoides besseyi]
MRLLQLLHLLFILIEAKLLTDEEDTGDDTLSIVDWPKFKLRNSTVLIEHQKRFWTLCADSFRVDVGIEICRQTTGKPAKLKTASRVPLDLPIAVELRCSSALTGHCPPVTTDLTIDCSDSMEVECFAGEETTTVQSTSLPKCPVDWFHLPNDGKCVGVPDEWKNDDGRVNLLNFDDSTAICHSIHPDANLVSFSSFTWKQSRDVLTKLISTIPDHLKKFPLLTSAVRARNQWRWSDQVHLTQTPVGNFGRCAAMLSNRTLLSVDCSESAYVPLCEINLAKNCVLSNGFYDGQVNKTISGKFTLMLQELLFQGANCLQWTDPVVLRNGLFSSIQRQWSHNFCRNPALTRSQPWCMISESKFQECDVPFCQTEIQKLENVGRSDQQQKCNEDEQQCGTSDQCVANEFFCDYEMDCHNGFDEIGCRSWYSQADFLQNFDSAGNFKLISEVSVVWRFVPHVQGCAKRCIENADFRCESFSYEPAKELCLLSRSTNNPAVLFERVDSFYYRRKFSEHDLKATKDPLTQIVEVEKSGRRAPVCVHRVAEDDVSRTCKHFGFGPPLFPLHNSTVKSAVELTNSWSLNCLRQSNCSIPDIFNSCRRLLRCSDCQKNQFACRTSGQCIDSWRVCDGSIQCADATDEIGCDDLVWRLWDGGEAEDVEAAVNATDGDDRMLNANLELIGASTKTTAEGRVQILFQNAWTDVCVDGIENGEQADLLCSKLGRSGSGRILPISEQTPTSITWIVRCRGFEECRPLRIQSCQRGILNLRCEDEQQPLCGRRFAKIRRRVARVVGGFDTLQSSFPWTASLRFRHDDSHHCGAVIFSSRFLLSAAHCFEKEKDPQNFYVVTGDWDREKVEGTEQTFNLTAIHFYPKYEDLFQHDIVILELPPSQEIRFNEASQPICLVPRGFRYRAGQVCLVSGFGFNGTSYPRKLQAAAMPILETEVCRNASKVYSAVSRTSFCAGYLSGGVDACQGDSGGPFACEFDGIFYLAGIISWGDGCAQESKPGINTMITPYLPWIESVTGIVA